MLPKEEHLDEMRAAGGGTWFREWDTVAERMAQNGKLAEGKLHLPTDGKSNYHYMQNSSSACAAINGVRTVCHFSEMLERIDPANFAFQRFFEAWTYMNYHALGTGRTKPDYGYGGCSISGIMACMNEYGLLPYSARISH